MTEVNTASSAFEKRVGDGLLKAERYCARLQRWNTTLLSLGLLSSSLSTLVGGLTAAHGPVIGAGTPGWKMSCALTAGFAFLTTLSMALQQQLKFGERLSAANQAAGRLRSLELSLATGSRPREEVMKEFEEILRSNPEPLR
jgi:hypothetical protein